MPRKESETQQEKEEAIKDLAESLQKGDLVLL